MTEGSTETSNIPDYKRGYLKNVKLVLVNKLLVTDKKEKTHTNNMLELFQENLWCRHIAILEWKQTEPRIAINIYILSI